MAKRHTVIGIKQAIHLGWMEKTSNCVLAGMDAKTIRQELMEYLSGIRTQNADQEKSDQAKKFIVNSLMRIWVSPDSDLMPLREALLTSLRKYPSMSLAIQWGMISAAYPFWFNVARQTGRLLALQDEITQMQIISRLKEQYGDRQTVSRYARFVIRSLVEWGILTDSESSGTYKKRNPIIISNTELATLMVESVLCALPEGREELNHILNNPGLFPFKIPAMAGSIIHQYSNRIDVERYGIDEEYIRLEKN